MATRAQEFNQLIARLEPEIRAAFMASVADLRANVDWTALLAALRASDIPGAVAALHIDPAAWAQYSTSLTQAYAAAGVATASSIGPIGTRFNMANPRAEQWVRENVGQSITAFSEEQIRTAREVIAAGYARGEHPHTIAVDLVGRATGPGGTRTGGVLGLDAPRARRLMNVTIGMRTPDGVAELVHENADGSLSMRYKVNKATAQRIAKAFRAGTAVPADERIISERQYSNALLLDRAETVAETETGNAVMSARDDEWHQFAESRGQNVIKTWRHRRGAAGEFRPDHRAMSGQSVRGLNTPFVFPDGTRMQHAHDPAGGAKHTIRCGCDTEYRIDHSTGLL